MNYLGRTPETLAEETSKHQKCFSCQTSWDSMSKQECGEGTMVCHEICHWRLGVAWVKVEIQVDIARHLKNSALSHSFCQQPVPKDPDMSSQVGRVQTLMGGQVFTKKVQPGMILNCWQGVKAGQDSETKKLPRLGQGKIRERWVTISLSGHIRVGNTLQVWDADFEN